MELATGPLAGASAQRIAHSFPSFQSFAYAHPLGQNRMLRLHAGAQDLTLAQHAVFMAFAEFRDAQGIVWPSVRTVAEHANCSERTVQEALPVLVRKQLLSVVAPSTPRRPTVYCVSLPVASQPVPAPVATAPLPIAQEAPPPAVSPVEPFASPNAPTPAPVTIEIGPSQVMGLSAPESVQTQERCSARTSEVQPAHPKETGKEDKEHARAPAQAHSREAQSVPVTLVPVPAPAVPEPRPVPVPEIPTTQVSAQIAALVSTFGLMPGPVKVRRAQRSEINRALHAVQRQTEAKARAAQASVQSPRTPNLGGRPSSLPLAPPRSVPAPGNGPLLRDLSAEARTKIFDDIFARLGRPRARKILPNSS
jgi:hypothetical protein